MNVRDIVDVIWSPVFVGICIFSALYFSIFTKFVQIRCFRQMLSCLLHNGNANKVGTSSFQSFCIALSGKVGTGNIVGVATAIGFGGPGAIVWMWIIALFGAASSFAESTLAQIYKERHNNIYYGGPAFYIEKGLNSKFLAILFAIITVISSILLLIPIQVNGISVSLNSYFELPNIFAGISVAILIGLIILGGIKRIASFAQFICPIMAIGYVILAIIILIINYDAIPAVFMDMVKSAFGLNPLLSGILGSTITWGVKRGIYSNEAGQGTGAIVSGVAEVSHPVKQGLAQSFSIYIDTLLVCSATAVMILSCKTFNVYTPDMTPLIQNPEAPAGAPGILYTIHAVGLIFGRGVANIAISAALFFFAFTTILAYCYYAESNLFYLYRVFPSILKYEKIVLLTLRLLSIVATIIGSITTPLQAWDLGDIGVGLMAWLNLITILLLSPKVFRSLKDYELQRKNGLEPKFDPKKLNIKNADFWEDKDSK